MMNGVYNSNGFINEEVKDEDLFMVVCVFWFIKE